MAVMSVEARGPVRVVSLTRPAQMNALNADLTGQLIAAFTALTDDTDARVVVLRAEGRAFCAGGDLKEGMPPEKVLAGDWPTARLVKAMRACPQPIVALVQGAAIGAGLALALAADIRLGGESLALRVGTIGHGLHGSELGIAWWLQKSLPLSKARELMLTNRRLGAAEALRLGLVSDVHPDADLDRHGLALADEIAAASRNALRLSKRTFDVALGIGSLDAALESDERAQSLLVAMRRAGV